VDAVSICVDKAEYKYAGGIDWEESQEVLAEAIVDTFDRARGYLAEAVSFYRGATELAAHATSATMDTVNDSRAVRTSIGA
jgi:hypothetical protein